MWSPQYFTSAKHIPKSSGEIGIPRTQNIRPIPMVLISHSFALILRRIDMRR